MSDERESAWQAWKAREARYRDSSMTDLRQAFEAGWEALVRPFEGVTLTPEEKRLVAWSLNHAAEEWSMNGNEREADVRWALAERFEASS